MTKITTLAGMEKDNAEFCKQALQTLNLPYAQNAGITVKVLRLDLLHPHISGNKWMKLQVWLERFKNGGYQGILTKGGPWSNHLHATSYTCYFQKIPLIAIVKGHEHYVSATLQDLKTWNTQLIFTNRSDYYCEEKWIELAKSLNYLYIPMGGDGEEGVLGVTEWFNQAKLPAFDSVFCAVGTGTTVLGIAASTLACTNLVGVDAGTGDKKLLEKLSEEHISIHGEKKVVLQHAPVKFGKISPDTIAFMQDWYFQHHFMLDALYTAPLCVHFKLLVENGQIPLGAKVLLLHTGGLQGNRSVSLLNP